MYIHMINATNYDNAKYNFRIFITHVTLFFCLSVSLSMNYLSPITDQEIFTFWFIIVCVK